MCILICITYTHTYTHAHVCVFIGSPSMIMQWREIRNNFMIDNYSPQENIDNDDGSAFFRTHDKQ